MATDYDAPRKTDDELSEDSRTLRFLPEAGLRHLVLYVGELAVASRVVKDSP